MWLHFEMKADLHFNTEFTYEAEQAFLKAVDDSKPLFMKGVPRDANPDEVGHIDGVPHFQQDRVELHFASGPYTRVHDALFRFRKQIPPALGKFRMGLRDIEISDYTVIMRGMFPEGFRVPELPFIKNHRWDTNEIVPLQEKHSEQRNESTLILELAVTAADLENRIPDRLVRLIEEKIEAATYGGKAEHWELLFESGPKPRHSEKDPTAEMLEQGWIKHAPARGQWIFGPQVVQLFRAFETIVMREIITPLGFSEMIFPKMVPWEIWMRSGHAKGIYPEVYYICTPKTRDPAFWEDVSDYFKVTGEVWVEEIRKRIDGPIGGMCYAQCPPFWPFVQGETLSNDCLPVRVFDRSGTSHRYESGGIHGIERVDEFHRIEILWFGTTEQTVDIAEKLHGAYHRVFEDILELEWRSAQVAPWFMAQEGMVGGESACGCGSRIGTTDYEAYLPYNESWLEFQNVSINGDKYPKGFNVKIQSGADCWSGCSGIGLERWTAAFLAQKGLKRENWPEMVARLVGEPKNLFTFL